MMKDLKGIAALVCAACVSACAGFPQSLSSSAVSHHANAPALPSIAERSDSHSGRLLVGANCGTSKPQLAIVGLPLSSPPALRRIPLDSNAKCAASFASRSGDLFVATSHAGVLAYALPLGRQNVPSFRLGTEASATGLAFGPNGDIFVANGDRQRIDVYRQPLSGGSKRAFAFARGGALVDVGGEAFDVQYSLYVANCGMHDVLVYGQPYNDESKPVATLSTPGGGCPASAVIGENSVLYVADSATNSVYLYSPPFTDASQPAVTISGKQSLLDAPNGLALDDSGDLYVANGAGGGLLAFTPPFSAGSAPAETISGLGAMMGLRFENSGI